MKALIKPEPTKREKEEAEAQDALPAASKRKHPDQPLQGGLGRKSGQRFGLNW
jgi:hypothetical protein